jgi:hypothetical protein
MSAILAAYVFSALVFVGAGHLGAALMFGLGLGGISVFAGVGLPTRTLVPLGLGLLIVLWIAWIDPPGDQRTTSVFAHGSAGVLLGWALAETARPHASWPRWGLFAVAGVFATGVAWELGELVVDAVFGTALRISASDSAVDLSANLVGAVVAVLGLRAWTVPVAR